MAFQVVNVDELAQGTMSIINKWVGLVRIKLLEFLKLILKLRNKPDYFDF